MSTTKLNDVLQILGMLGIMASLVFVGLQLRQTDTIASIDSQEGAVQRHYDMLSILVEHADVWQRGCVGEKLTKPEQVQFAKMFTIYRNNSFAGWRRVEITQYREMDSRYSIYAFAANVHRYPGFAAVYRSQLEWDKQGVGHLGPMIEKYVKLIEQRIEELAELEPNPDYDAQWCGRT